MGMNWKRLAKLIAGYFFAVLATLIVIGITVPDVKSESSDAGKLVAKWHISDCNDTLLVELPDKDGIKIGISIERHKGSETLKAAGIIRDLHGDLNRNIVLAYVSDGKYGVPMILCGSEVSGSKLVWCDYNTDSSLDILVDYTHKMRKINIEGDWIFGQLVPWKDEEKIFDTGDGVYHRFDPSSGEWRILDPNELPVEQEPLNDKRPEQPFKQHDDFERLRKNMLGQNNPIHVS